jgi:hypothetical protein
MSSENRGKKLLRQELADEKRKLREHIKARAEMQSNVMKMVSYATGIAEQLKKAEDAMGLAKMTLEDLGDHSKECKWAPGVDCDCGLFTTINLLDDLTKELSRPPGPDPKPPEPKPEPAFDPVAWAKAEIHEHPGQSGGTTISLENAV